MAKLQFDRIIDGIVLKDEDDSTKYRTHKSFDAAMIKELETLPKPKLEKLVNSFGELEEDSLGEAGKANDGLVENIEELTKIDREVYNFEEEMKTIHYEIQKRKLRKAWVEQKMHHNENAQFLKVTEAKTAQELKEMAKWLSSSEAEKPYSIMRFTAIQEHVFECDGMTSETVSLQLPRFRDVT